MSVQVGEVAYVKTTQEPVFVLKIRKRDGALVAKLSDSEYAYFDTEVTVRIPVVTREGIQHRIAEFFEQELETQAERELRFEEIRRRQTETALDDIFKNDRSAADPAETLVAPKPTIN